MIPLYSKGFANRTVQRKTRLCSALVVRVFSLRRSGEDLSHCRAHILASSLLRPAGDGPVMPGPARRYGDGADSYAHSIARVACAQVVYAQAERLAEVASKSAKPGAQNLASTPRSAAKGRAGAAPTDSIAPSTIFACESVADSLADVASAFVTHVGRRASARAELGGRTSVALTDVLACLQGMAPVTQSYTRDLARYAMLEEIPFPSQIPAFPLPIPVASTPAGGGAAGAQLPPDPVDGSAGNADAAEGEAKRAAERPWIEPWMPPLPPTRTYKNTPGVVKLDSGDGRGGPDRAKLSTQRRQVEQSLARLKEGGGVGNGGADLKSSAMALDGSALGLVSATHALAENPFLAPPKVGTARIIDEDMTELKARDPAEPAKIAPDADGDSAMRDSNVSGVTGPGEGNDPKRARVSRIFTEARGTGATANGGSASAKAKKSEDAMDVAP